MMVITPFLAYLSLFLYLHHKHRSLDWRRNFLRAGILWGIWMVLTTEVLSLVRAVTPAGLALAWLALGIACAILLWKARASGEGLRWPRIRIPDGFLNRVLLLLVLVIVVTTGLVAFLAPPHTPDSLVYHMSRVAHWAHEKSLRHYATGIERQNFMSPAAEMGILHFYVLLGGDRLANFVEWFAMVGSLIGVSFIAKQLGANQVGQIFAAVFAATLPQGIAQASSTMTDYVVTIWLVCVASESLDLIEGEGPHNLRKYFFVAAAAGMAILSKPTAFSYLLPFVILLGLYVIREKHAIHLGKVALLVVVVVFMLNAGHSIRNLQTYGNVFGLRSFVNLFPGSSIVSPGEWSQLASWKALVSNLLRNASLHAGTPFGKINHALYTALLKLHVKMGIGLTDPRTTLESTFLIYKPTTGEARAANLYHAILIIAVVLLQAVFWKRFRGTRSPLLTFVVSLTFVVMSYVQPFTVFGSRYHLAFFVLFAPIAGFVLERILPGNVLHLVGIALVIASWSWLVDIQSRPLFPRKAGGPSLLTRAREAYMGCCGREGYLFPLTDMIQESQCSQVGLIMPGDSLEYVIWSRLGAPREGLRIEWLSYTGHSEKYADDGFEPCAVVCRNCPDEWKEVRGMPIVYDRGSYKLYLAPEIR
jgi:hypothetical protein